jgi:hypothetical protein
LDSPKTAVPQIFESSAVTALVGIQPVHLNTFIERKLYGIAPSVRAETGRGGRRIFSETDVFGIGLVWWLFESGLRSQTIQAVLSKTTESKQEATANDAAIALIQGATTLLLVDSHPRTGSPGEDSHFLQVRCVKEVRGVKVDMRKCLNSVLVVPVGNLFARLKKAMAEFGR